MSACVIDASVTMAWSFADEKSAPVDALFERLATEGASIPAHWSVEVANAFLMAERRGRSTAADTAARLALLEPLPLERDDSDVSRSSLIALARSHGLTVYDAAYLELALRRQLPMATLDNDLKAACRTAGVPLLV